MTTDLTALPPERLGQLLRAARRDASLSRRRAAKFAALSVAALVAVERGWEVPTQATLNALLGLYGTTAEQLIPQRAPLLVDGASLALDATSVVRIAASTARDDLLRGYIKLATDARDNGALDALSLRAADVHSLAVALGTDDAVLVERIAALLECSLEDAASIGRLLRTFAGPIVGVAFSVSVIGGSIVAGNTSGAQLSPASANTPSAAVVLAAAPMTTTTSAALPEATRSGALTSDNEGALHVVVSDATQAPITMFAPSTTTAPAAPTPDIGVLPGESPTLIFEG